MKRIGVLLLGVAVLAGCGVQPAYETLTDVYSEQALPNAANILVALPPDASVMTGENAQSGSIWLCDGYSVVTQTLTSGDLDATLRTVTGHGKEDLQVIGYEDGSLKRWECVWLCAGEGGDQTCRTVILDDGAYHYALTLQTDASQAGKLADTWQEIIASFSLDIVP